jgi:hypothetical protein
MDTKYIIGIICIVAILIVGIAMSMGGGDDNSSSDLNTSAPQKVALTVKASGLEDDETESNISGSTDADYITLSSVDLNLTDVKINITNGTFDYIITVPKDKNSVSITVSAPKMGNKESNTKTVDIKRTKSPEKLMEEYKEECESIAYAKLEKNADKFVGDKVTYSGEVIQIQEDSYGAGIRLDIGGGDIIYVFYYGENDIYEGDYITVYGTITGDYTYQSIADWTITVPSMDAKYID